MIAVFPQEPCAGCAQVHELLFVDKCDPEDIRLLFSQPIGWDEQETRA